MSRGIFVILDVVENHDYLIMVLETPQSLSSTPPCICPCPHQHHITPIVLVTGTQHYVHISTTREEGGEERGGGRQGEGRDKGKEEEGKGKGERWGARTNTKLLVLVLVSNCSQKSVQHLP